MFLKISTNYIRQKEEQMQKEQKNSHLNNVSMVTMSVFALINVLKYSYAWLIESIYNIFNMMFMTR